MYMPTAVVQSRTLRGVFDLAGLLQLAKRSNATDRCWQGHANNVAMFRIDCTHGMKMRAAMFGAHTTRSFQSRMFFPLGGIASGPETGCTINAKAFKPLHLAVGWQRQQRRGHKVAAAIAEATESSTAKPTANSSSKIPLPNGEIHLWWLEAEQVQSQDLMNQYLAMLPESEQAYIAEGANMAVRKERLLARALVRAVLTRYCEGSIPAKDLRFEFSPGGKPWLVSEDRSDKSTGQLHFNLTHTDRLLGVAVSRCGFVGLDSENSSRLTKFDPVSLAKRRFSEREYAVLTGFENLAERQRLFIRLWCLKEAYVKATGRGIMAPPGLKAFTFELLLNIKVRPSRFRPKKQAPSESSPAKETEPRSNNAQTTHEQQEAGSQSIWKYSLDESSNKGQAWNNSDWEGNGNRGSSEVWGAESRAAFALQMQPPESDEMAWETWLMELCGGHTAALVAESGRKSDTLQSFGSRPSLKLKCFKTVPLVSEEQGDGRYCRVIGHGHSLFDM